MLDADSHAAFDFVSKICFIAAMTVDTFRSA